MSGIHAAGISGKLIYDNCDYKQYFDANVNQAHYRLYQGAFENKRKCVFDQFYHPYDLVDVESELRNQTRPASNCASMKYRGVPKTGKCERVEKPLMVDGSLAKSWGNYETTNCSIDGTLYTFDKSIPVVYPPEVCPIVHNNIPKRHCPGYVIPEYITK